MFIQVGSHSFLGIKLLLGANFYQMPKTSTFIAHNHNIIPPLYYFDARAAMVIAAGNDSISVACPSEKTELVGPIFQRYSFCVMH